MTPKATLAWKMPPPMKVYEALGALGDGRVVLIDERRATVKSSEGDRLYDVECSPDWREISSNDNASYWQGYLGYPATAVLIARGFYHPREDVLRALSEVPWKELNRRFRNDYERTLAEVMARAEQRGFDLGAICDEVEAVLDALRVLAPMRGVRRKPPAVPKQP
jgi:hypothetical protein